VGLGDDPVPDVWVQAGRSDRVEQDVGVLVVQAGDLQLRQPPHVWAGPSGREQHGDRLGEEPTGDEGQDLR
jgi:hypothetical protein